MAELQLAWRSWNLPSRTSIGPAKLGEESRTPTQCVSPFAIPRTCTAISAARSRSAARREGCRSIGRPHGCAGTASRPSVGQHQQPLVRLVRQPARGSFVASSVWRRPNSSAPKRRPKRRARSAHDVHIAQPNRVALDVRWVTPPRPHAVVRAARLDPTRDRDAGPRTDGAQSGHALPRRPDLVGMEASDPA